MTAAHHFPTVNRRHFTAGLVLGASLAGHRAVAAQETSASGQLDTDDGSFTLDDAARAHLHWWTTPAGVTRAYVGGPGAQLHFRLAQPNRPRFRPVILLHDGGLSGRVWDHAMSALAQGRAVIAPDLPSHGDSDGDPQISTGGHAAAIMRIADQLDLKQFDIVAEGHGVHVAMAITAVAPNQVGRLVLSHIARPALMESPHSDPANPSDGAFLTSAWSTFTQGYGADAEIGLLDRDFSDLLRGRADAPRDYGALFLASSLLHNVLVIETAGDTEAASFAETLRNGRIVSRNHWMRGAASQNTKAWVETVTTFLNEASEYGDVQTVNLPEATSKPGSIVRRFMSTPHGQMHYRIIQGNTDDIPLVCFHMSPRSGAYYESLMASLAVSGRTVLAVDSVGYGESFKPKDWLNIPGYAAHMGHFLDALGAPQVDLMGDHTGSKIAIETTRQRSDIIRRVVMSTAGVYSVEEQRGWQKRMGGIPVEADGSHHAAMWERYHTLNGDFLDSEQNAFRFYETIRSGPCMWWGPRAANLYILGQILPEIEHRILLVCSDEDSLIEPTRRGAALLKNGRYVEFPGQGNSMIEYRADAVAPVIAAFLAEV